MAGSKAASGRQPIFGAAVLLGKPAKLSRERILDQLREVVGQAGARVHALDEGGSKGGLLAGLRGQTPDIKVEIAGVRLVIRDSSRPLCSPSAAHAFINPAVWRGAAGAVINHKAHLLVAEDDAGKAPSTRDALFDRATAVTLATAAIASLSGADAVIWLPARNAVPMATFGSEMERFMDGQAPLQFWLRWQVLPPPLQQEKELGQLSGEALNPGVATIGMAAFMGAEIIAPPSSCQRDDMLDQVFALASAVIDDNAELKDGGVHGRPNEVMVRLHLRKSGPHSDLPYWEVLPRPTAAAKPAPAAKPVPAVDPAALAEGPEPSARLLQGESEDAPLPERHLRLVVPGK